MSDATTSAKKTCLLHGPVHSSEDYKVLKEYTKKRSAQRTYKDKQAHSSRRKCAKNIKYEDATQEVNIIKSNDEPIAKKKKEKIRKKYQE